MSVCRANAGIAVLNEKLYVIGGSQNFNSLSSAECYDPIQDVWQSIAPMAESRVKPGVTVAKGLLYAVGGCGRKTAERYDPETNKWTTICSLRENLYPYASCNTLNDKVIISCEDRFEEYDALSNEWKEIKFVKPPEHCYCIFSYSGKLLTSQFAEM